MDNYLGNVVEKEVGDVEETAQRDILAAILTEPVFLGAEAPIRRATIGKILFQQNLMPFAEETESYGVSLCKGQDGLEICLHSTSLINQIRGLQTEKKCDSAKGLTRLLLRLGVKFNARTVRRTVGGVQMRCVIIDYDACKRWANTTEKFSLQ